MKYWDINGEPVQAHRLATALHKYGQRLESKQACAQFGVPVNVTVKRINFTQYKKLGGRP